MTAFRKNSENHAKEDINKMNYFRKDTGDIKELDTDLTAPVSTDDTTADAPFEKTAAAEFGKELLSASPSPHIKSSATTRQIMLDVLIALMPAFIWGIIVFGTRALMMGLISVASSVLFEGLFQLVLKRKRTVGDLSAAVTGLLLAMNLSVSVPYWIPVVGAFFAIVVVKGLFGGIGKNIVNPALAARVFLFAWPAEMNLFPAAGDTHGIISSSADIIASATPLSSLKQTGEIGTTVFDLFIGNIGGCIGEVSSLFLIVGGIYLLMRKVIRWETPVAFIGTVAAIALIFPRVGTPIESMAVEVLSGGVMICAIFMATDYTTTPVTSLGKIIFGIGCGLITMLIRHFGGYPEGVSFSILIMNLLVYYIEKLTAPTPYGGKKNVKE